MATQESKHQEQNSALVDEQLNSHSTHVNGTDHSPTTSKETFATSESQPQLELAQSTTLDKGLVPENSSQQNSYALPPPPTTHQVQPRATDNNTNISSTTTTDDLKDKDGVKPDLQTASEASNHLDSSPRTTSTNRNGNGIPHTAPHIPRTSKPNFFSKLIHILVPCISPSSSSHPVDIDEGASSLPLSKEKSTQKASPLPETSTSTSPIKPSSTEITQGAQTALRALPSTTTTVDSDTVRPSTPIKIPPEAETEGLNFTSAAVQPPGSTGVPHPQEKPVTTTLSADGDDSDGTSIAEEEEEPGSLDEPEDEEDKLIREGGAGIPIGPDGVPRPLLPPIAPHHAGRKCLILDLDETLVHSSFKSIQQADYVVPVEIEYHWHNVYVIKRPGVDNFLKKMGEIYEVVVFTASLSKYADPVLDKLDIHQVVSHRLFRESCHNHRGNYVKDLSQLGRPISDTIILDNSPASYIFHPNNAVPVSSWFNDPHDTELTDLVPFLADLGTVDDVRGVLDGAR